MKTNKTSNPKLETIHAFCQNTLATLAKTSQMRQPTIQIDARLAKHNASLTAMYLPDLHAILMSESWVGSASPAEVLLTLFHEFRHAYQSEAVHGRAKLDEGIDLSVLKIWKNELEHPIQPDPNRPDDPKYLDQAIEKDAVAFATRTLEAFFSQGG